MSDSVFTVKVGEKELVLKIKKPTAEDHRQARMVYNRTFKDAMKSGCILSSCLEEELRKAGFWSEEKDLEFKTLVKEIDSMEQTLRKGGMKLSEAKDLALSISDTRRTLVRLLGEKSKLDNTTAESQAENERLNYLVSVCVVYNDSNKPYFSTYDDFLNAGSDPVVQEGINKFLAVFYPMDEKIADLPENKFLKKFGFINDKFMLVNKDGKLVDRKNRLVNEEGQLVDENNQRIDDKGNLVDEDGNQKVEELPFLDDEGNVLAA